MNIILRTLLSISLVIVITQIILIVIYKNTITKAENMKGSDNETYTKAFFHLKTILGNSLEVLVSIGVLYYCIYLGIVVFSGSKFYEKYFETKSIAIQSDSEYSNVVLEIFLSFWIKLLPDILVIYFSSISIEEIDIIESKGGFAKLDR